MSASQPPAFLAKYVGNRHLFSFLKPMEATNPMVAECNSVLNIAPTFKWALSIVPMLGIFTGNPPVEKLDIQQTFALFTTGCVWSVYAVIIRPQWMVTMELPNGVGAEQLKAAAETAGATDSKIMSSGGKNLGVYAFADTAKADALLKAGTVEVAGQGLTAGTSGLNWFNRMLPGSRALFLVNCGLAVVHGWNLRRVYVYNQEKAAKAAN
eukprot:CAMPEP_0174284322 /NCGR_PEP_ID=MMETSP0809-20121228/5083_1 /TAXON_ID=73025 ORGANISM="Eutreptiella gymnastica-like, Strain CCMP1594" /NCGR_SAMPLE_ID=MMETSP0809 /ASSEMBLY_ACC=CAM_ASM_000658 /LENGTH=209 /DNA_ID=CAMNT_0015379795 /DNA_START=35 /DNA_END=664 /DNA_ORIENTATION=+